MGNNMREIEARVWQDGQMRHLNQVFIGVGQIGFSDTHYVDLNADDKEDAQVMLYTGFQDRNSKKIYESDILRSIENDNVYLVEEFVPIQRTDNLTRLGVYIDGEYHKVPEDMVLNDDWKSWPEMYEVIGNIYENPELLKSA